MPNLSVIIPTFNRAARLRACLRALSEQTQTPTDFEVLVVLDGSSDGTREMLATLQTPYAVRVFEQENQGQHIARNLGARAASGDVCLFLDDDIIAGPQLVQEHLALHRDTPGAVGIGQIGLHLADQSDAFLRFYADGWHQHYEALNAGRRRPSWLDCFGGNVSVSREKFLAVGGFSADIRRSHDVELGYRLERSGLSFAYLPAALGTQHERKDFDALSSDFERAGAAWVALCRLHPAMSQQLLGGLKGGTRAEKLVRRALLRAGVAPGTLYRAGRVLRVPARRRSWQAFLRQYCYWRGFSRTADAATWRLLYSGPMYD